MKTLYIILAHQVFLLGICSGAETTTPLKALADLPLRTVGIGKGGVDGFVSVDTAGSIHVIYGGKYRIGPAPDKLGSEEQVTDITPLNGVRIAIDARRPHIVFTAGMTARATRSYDCTARTVDSRGVKGEPRWRQGHGAASVADGRYQLAEDAPGRNAGTPPLNFNRGARDEGGALARTRAASSPARGYMPGKGDGHILYRLPHTVRDDCVEFEFKGMTSPKNIQDDHGSVGVFDRRGIEEPIQYLAGFSRKLRQWQTASDCRGHVEHGGCRWRTHTGRFTSWQDISTRTN